MLEILRYVFLPHADNNHRPKALHLDSLAAYVLIFVLLELFIPFGAARFPDVLGYATDIRVEELLRATNTKRASLGLGGLALNPQLSFAAAQKANDMFKLNYWAHNNPEGKRPWDFITDAGYRYSIAGENLAKNFSTSSNVVEAWVASPTHYENLIKPGYKEVGFAVVNGVLNGEETTLVVQMFGAQSSEVKLAGIIIPTKMPVVTRAPSPTPISIVNGESTEETVASLPAAVNDIELTSFAAVTNQPTINLFTVKREVVLIFLLGLLSVLSLDAYIAHKRAVVRITGHNMAHILFFGVVMVCIFFIRRGALL